MKLDAYLHLGIATCMELVRNGVIDSPQYGGSMCLHFWDAISIHMTGLLHDTPVQPLLWRAIYSMIFISLMV